MTTATTIPGADQAQALASGWEFYRGPLDPRFQVWHADELVTWQDVTVPHCFNHYDACDPDTPAYRGPGWYRTRLTLLNPYPGGRVLLHFGAAGQAARIFIGTTLVGEHTGGYDEFVVDITEAIGTGRQTDLAVYCDNSRDLERLPSDLSDFTLYGGLYRAVHLVYVPPISIETVHTRVQCATNLQTAEVSVFVRLYAPRSATPSVSIRVRIWSPSSELLMERTLPYASAEAELLTHVIQSPKLWATTQPQLYRCEVTVGTGELANTASHRFGVRHTRFELHGPFYLNGTRLLLRGTHRHEDHAGCAAAMSDALIGQEMKLIKDMGANFIRLAHYQQSRVVLDLCDELGLLVWEEVPWCRSGVFDDTFQRQGRTLLTRMIDQHSNHPSILLWGLGNEDDWPAEPAGADHAAIRTYMTGLRDLAHDLDPTRLTTFRRCEFASDIPDVYSPSIWAGWYKGSYHQYGPALEEARYSVPHLLHAEWGADSHAGRHSEGPDPALANLVTTGSVAEQGFDFKLSGGSLRMSRDGEWSETYACELFDWFLKTSEQLSWFVGSAQWTFKDFTTPLRSDNPIPRVNQKGLVARDMTLKEGYFVFQSYWATEPMVHIYGHSWPVRWGHADQLRDVHIYSNCPEVELFVNGVSRGVRHRNLDDFPCAGLRWSEFFQPGHNMLRAVSRVDGGVIEDHVAFVYDTMPWGTPAGLTLEVDQPFSRGLLVVHAQVVDAAGHRCLDARQLIRYSVAGNAELVDNQGTTTGSRVVQLANGRGQITLRVHGDAVVGVVCRELVPAFLKVGVPTEDRLG